MRGVSHGAKLQPPTSVSRIAQQTFFAGLVTILFGCSPYLKQPNVIRGIAENTPDTILDAVEANNKDALAYYSEVEWRLNADRNQRPRLGVALSGGGMRSAIFSLGVLTELHDLEIFPQKTDILSAVSGGGYIASWFYGQQILHGHTPSKILKPEEAPQRYLKDNAEFVNLKKDPNGWAAIAINVGIGIPVNLLANGLWGLRANTTVVSYYYEDRFRQIFWGNQGSTTKHSISWEQIGDLIRRSAEPGHNGERLPNFILNTTVDLGVGTHEEEDAGFHTIYEFTPQRFGSDGMGYYCLNSGHSESATLRTGCPLSAPLASVERTAITSGAAFDSSFLDSVAPGIVERKLVSAINFDLGFWFESPSTRKSLCWMKYIPLVHFLNMGWYRKDAKGCRVLLTDGGHSENLGVYSLVRRVPSAIIVVDAEQDRDQEFSSYHRLRKILLRDLNVVLSVPAIDEKQWTEGPIYIGSVGKIPLPGDSQPLSILVVYIKLPTSVEVKWQCDARKLPPTVCDYHEENQDFPQDSTFADQSHDPDQFVAYRDLGAAIIENSSSELFEQLVKIFPDLPPALDRR